MVGYLFCVCVCIHIYIYTNTYIEYWSGWPFPSPGDLPNPGIKPRSPALQVVSLPDEPPGKPKNTGVGSLSLLQWTNQESNPGIEPGYPALQEDSLPAELRGKPYFVYSNVYLLISNSKLFFLLYFPSCNHKFPFHISGSLSVC